MLPSRPLSRLRTLGLCLLLGAAGRVLAQADITEVLADAATAEPAKPDDSLDLVGHLIGQYRDGHVRAFRDLSTLVDQPLSGARAREALVKHTLFEGDIDPATASRQALLDFYYAHADSLRYSELLAGYLVRPLERQPVKYELNGLDAHQRSDRSMHLRKYVLYTEQAIEHESVVDLRDLAEKIADLHLIEGQAFLLDWLDGEAARLLSTDLDAFLHYLEQLLTRPSPEVAEAIFEAERRGYLRAGSMAYYLSRLCNVPFSAAWDTKAHRAHYDNLLDSLGGMARVREFGYETSVGFSAKHFRDPVDYFGRILARRASPGYVQHNALLDLAATHHPRALFYISTQFLAARQGRPTAYPAVYYLYLLRKLANLGVSVQDASGEMVYQLEVTGDRTAWINFVRYWATRYEDYDFDEHRGSFINRHDQTLETENLERLFRLLNSESSAVALQAYTRLTRADPVEVGLLVLKYKDLLRSTNPQVPALKDGHLENTAQLTAYCLQNRIDFEPAPGLRRRLDSLLLPLDPRARIRLENGILADARLSELTAIEYWAAIHQYDLEAGFSVGRVLDYAYTYHWDELTASDAQLRLFLKKAVLFSRMEGIGISDSYLIKFASIGPLARKRIEDLIRSESDKHIARTLKRLLAIDQAVQGGLSEVDDFLESPEVFTREEALELPAPTLEQLSELLWRTSDASTAKARSLYNAYLRQHLTLGIVPDLMSLLIREDHPEMVSGLLSNVYHYTWEDQTQVQSVSWLSHWQAHNPTYRTWGQAFYREHVAKLRRAERVTGVELNAILTSPYFDQADRPLVLASLPKLVSPRQLFMLRFTPAPTWAEHTVLDELPLKYKDLQDLDKLFETVEPGILVDYILRRASDLDPETMGKLVNELMRKPWIDNLLDSPDFAYAKTFTTALETYLEQSAYLSEFEEQYTTLNLARLAFIGKSSIERLQASLALEVDAPARLRIQETILARVSYAELAEIVALYPRLQNASGKRPYNFLNRDFGLPIFDLTASSDVDTFVERHARLRPRDLYLAYLRDFGLELVTPAGALDYLKIYRILTYDIVLPFIGGGGNRRDWYTYGVIRLLELDEGTRLGFHEKLNENQWFYSYTSSKRADAWSHYLLKTGKVTAAEAHILPSFNTASAEEE